MLVFTRRGFTFGYSITPFLRQQTSFRQAAAIFFLLIFVALWSSKSLHGWLSHHEHAEHPVCEAESQSGGTHIHDQRYAADDCSICAFVLAIPELVSISSSIVAPETMPQGGASFFYSPLPVRTACDTNSNRGPPVL